METLTPSRKNKKNLQAAAIGLAAGLLALTVWGAGLLDLWEFDTWTWRLQLFARPAEVTSRVKLILVDQASLDWGKKENGWSWPWPREVYTAIIDFCRRGGAKAVAFDVFTTEPSPYGVSDDRNLAEGICRGPAFVAPICLGKEAGEETAWPEGVPCRSPFLVENLQTWLTDPRREVIFTPKATFPVPPVASAARALAAVADAPDCDGLFRRAFLFRVFDQRAVPSLALAAFRAGRTAPLTSEAPARENAEELPSPTVSTPPAGDSCPLPDAARIEEGNLHMGALNVPLDHEGKLLVRFRGRTGETFQTFSAAAVVQSELRLQANEGSPLIDPSTLRDSYVLLGLSAPGLMDLRSTPLSEVTPGVEIHATVLDNLLAGDFLRDASPFPIAAVTLLLAVGTALATARNTRGHHAVLTFGLLLPLPGVISLAAYPLGFRWPFVVGELAVGLSLVGTIILNYQTEGRQKAFIKKAFRHYLSPAVIERILDDPSKLKLGGERRTLTIFFSDLEGFSTFSERLEPETLTHLLNDYLTQMTDIILEEGGTLDKYEGDAIIAFWNAPLAQSDHALRACRTALRCQRCLAERRAHYVTLAGAELRMRIGLHTGDVVVGNMGSHQRFDYTVLGDAANLASRLEGANKALGSSIMVSEAAWTAAAAGGDGLQGRELGRLRVVGRKTPVRVFEPVALAHEEWNGVGDAFAEALALCYENRWNEALARFELLPDDPASRAYAGRCRQLLESGDSWDCIWNLSQK